MSLGPFIDISLADARELASKARALVRQGINPIDARKAEQKVASETFGSVADAWLAQKLRTLRNDKSHSMLERDVKIVMEPLRDLPVESVDLSAVLKLLEPVWTQSPDLGRRLRQKVEAILDAAQARGLRSGENPARWRGHLQHLLPRPPKVQREHFAAMPYKDVPAFMRRLRHTESVSARALEFCVLNASRTGEVLGARWDEIDLASRVWTIPPARMKAGRQHTVPLSSAAIRILREMAEIRTGEYVFPSRAPGKCLAHDGLAGALRREGIKNYTVHGFRSSFRDWAGNETSAPRDVAEAALAHQVGSEVERAYRRSDALEKRRALMEQWADYILPEQKRGG